MSRSLLTQVSGDGKLLRAHIGPLGRELELRMAPRTFDAAVEAARFDETIRCRRGRSSLPSSAFPPPPCVSPAALSPAGDDGNLNEEDVHIPWYTRYAAAIQLTRGEIVVSPRCRGE